MKLLLIHFSILFSVLASVQKDPIERTWFNQEKTSKIQIYKATDGKFYGKIVWLAKPLNDKGINKVDKNNPENSLRNQPLNGLLILRGFNRTEELNVYDNGKIYDPNNGKTYCAKITLTNNSLKLRGNICGFSFLGRSSVFTIAD